ncbi:MAG: polysaccharide deacetylase family protein [Candidatus Acidiferrales bacterium]
MAKEQNPIILTYHSISDGRPPLSISTSRFSAQMEWLSNNARVVPLADIVNTLKDHHSMPSQTVVLTFDDGYQDFYSDAVPVLRRWGFPATVFLATAYCGRTNSWPGQPRWVDEKPLLTWGQIEELARMGFQFGSHSATHPDMTRVSEAEAEAEIVESKYEIGVHTGAAAAFFCYPYGRWGNQARDIVSRHFRGACSTVADTVGSTADPFVLPRVETHYLRNTACFRSLFTRRFSVYIDMRRAIRRLRQQPEGQCPGS